MVKLGKAFFDNVYFFKKKYTLPRSSEIRGWGIRLTFLYLLLIGFIFIIFLRIFNLTVINGSKNRKLSEANRTQTIIIHAPRGIFYDRKGIPLVENILGVRVGANCENDKSCLSKFLTLDEFKKQKDTLSLTSLEYDFFRKYFYSKETAHILGYLSEINKDELNNPFYKYQDYILGDHLGRMGLELVYEDKLQGIDGKELVEIDANGKQVRSLGKVEPVPGSDIKLSIDIDLQKIAYEALEENIGAVVVSKVKTGEILALVSKPGFDPNQIHQGLDEIEFEKLYKNPDQPFFNRSISGVYPPGSIFKIITSTAGLESNKITKSTLVEDTGIIRVNQFSFANWYFTQYGKTEGLVDIYKALARSNDIFFYKMGENIGISEIAKWGKKFGIGQKTGIELTNEAEGLMPDEKWKKEVKKENWYLGDSYHIAIGQGDLLTTPLQANMWTNVIANNGKLCKPTLLKTENANCQNLNLKKETISIITESMRRACDKGENTGYQGTGSVFFDFFVVKERLSESGGVAQKIMIPVACKTGTAEVGDIDENTHAWFTVFAPLSDLKNNSDNKIISGESEISVTVLVEKGGEGSQVAAPIAKKILEEWFKR